MSFNQLKNYPEKRYDITHKKPFSSTKIDTEYVNKCFDFAYAMSFGKEGEHRDHRTGGTHARKNGEIFSNTFQGKLAEYCVWSMFKHIGVDSEEPSTDTWDLGIWDDTDLSVNSHKINIKSAAHFSNLLLLETKDWDENGFYKPNSQNESCAYDFFILVRINPDGKKIMSKKRWLYSESLDRKDLYDEMIKENWLYDIPGFITRQHLIEIINKRNILPRGASLNGKMNMDASNYYCQTGDMADIKEIIHLLKTEV